MRGRLQLLDLLGRWDDRPTAVPFAELLASLRSLEIDRADLAGALSFDDRAYGRASISRRPHYEALVLCWKSGQASAIHDHAGSSCAVRVIEGRATETHYTASPCGLLAPRRSRVHGAGEVFGCRGGGIHQMANLEPSGSDLITLHVYSPPPSGWRLYPVGRTVLTDNNRLVLDPPATRLVDLVDPTPGAFGGRKVGRGIPCTN